MRIIQVGCIYSSKIYIMDEDKLIFKLDCQCPDFRFRKIKKIGKFADVKYYAEPCKHLRLRVWALQKDGYILKKPEEMNGPDYCPAELRRELMEIADHKCQADNCGCDSHLIIHRKIRGSNGGKYNKTNCVVLCVECHKMRHSN